jgi:hypothetical protein
MEHVEALPGESMYLIGGCMRAGKSTLARMLCARASVAWASTDAIRDVVIVVNPELRYLALAEPDVVVQQAEDFYPVLDAFARVMHNVAGKYAIEGVAFLPRHADQLRSHLPVRACFLGWSHVDIDSLEAAGHRNDWLSYMDQEFRAGLPRRLVELSRLVERECQEFDLPYVDMAGDFESKLAYAYELLTE